MARVPRQSIFLIVLLLANCWLVPARATSVRAVALEELIEASELVFEGEVIGVLQRVSRGKGLPKTCVQFEVIDRIKGDAGASPVELCFLGGTIGGYTLRVTDSKIPEPGEKGIYFVETTGRSQANPLYGWSQGHFLIKRNPASGEQCVTTAGERPVLEMDFSRQPHAGLSDGVAAGVSIAHRSALHRAMSVGRFKQRLREHLAERSQ